MTTPSPQIDPFGSAARGPLTSAELAAREAEWRRLFEQAAPDEDGAVPPNVVATPGEVRGADDDVRWWRPGWTDSWRLLGWRWLFLMPAALLLIFLVAPWRAYAAPLFVLGAKLLILMIGVALSLATFALRRAARARTEPFCIFCGYNLSGLPDNYRCPECGRPYSWRLIAEYRRDPEWFIQRWNALRKLPAAPPAFTAGKIRRRSRDGT